MLASDRMTRDVYTVAADDPLDQVFKAMRKLDIRHMPVVAPGGELLGIVSDRDVLLRAIECRGSVIVPEIPVSEAMTADVVTCHEGTAVGLLARTMIDQKIDCIPVVEEGDLVGIVTSTDLLELLCGPASAPVRQLIPFNFNLRTWRNAPLAMSPASRI